MTISSLLLAAHFVCDAYLNGLPRHRLSGLQPSFPAWKLASLSLHLTFTSSELLLSLHTQLIPFQFSHLICHPRYGLTIVAILAFYLFIDRFPVRNLLAWKLTALLKQSCQLSFPSENLIVVALRASS